LDRAQQIGLFSYSLVREASSEALSTRQRGRLVRALAAREHPPRRRRLHTERARKLLSRGDSDGSDRGRGLSGSSLQFSTFAA
jgi:hypothetical protein